MKFVALLALALTALSLNACSVWGEQYTLWIDPAFSADEVTAWKTAARTWEDSVPVIIYVKMGVCNGNHNGLICTHATDSVGIATCARGIPSRVQGCTGRSFNTNGGDIYIDVPFMHSVLPGTPYDMAYVYVHEMGHAQGLNHGGANNNGVAGTAMYPSQGDSAQGAVTCWDEAQWYQVRNMPPVCNTPGQ